jgi:heme exporter protein B
MQDNGMTQTLALFEKDVRAELRTRVAVSSIGVFTFSALLLLGLATAALKEVQSLNILRLTDPITVTDVEAQLRPAWDAASKMGMLWILLCFAAFAGLSHSFVHEEETGTVTALRLTMASGAVYAGKLLFNLVLIIAVATVITPVYLLMTGMPTGPFFVFVLVMLSGCIGLAGAATIVAALAAKARGTGALYGAIGLPLLVVFFMLLINAAQTLYIVNPSTIRVVRDVGGLLSYGVLLIAVSALTFHFVWEE